MIRNVKCSYAQLRAGEAARGRFSLKYFNIALVLLLSALGIFYLLNISALTVRGFSLSELKAQAATLASENLAAQEQVNTLQSYYALASRTQKLDMVAVGEVDYLTLNPAAVAKK